MLFDKDGNLRTPSDVLMGEMIPLSYADIYQACTSFGEEVNKGIKAGWPMEFQSIENELKV